MSDTNSKDLCDKMIQHYVGERVFICQYPECLETFTMWEKFVVHIGKHTMISKKLESIPNSDESDVINFKPCKWDIDDNREIDSTKILTCPYETCDRYYKPYVSEESLESHIRSKHSSKDIMKAWAEFDMEQLRKKDGKYRCDNCKFIGNKWTVKKHRIIHLSKDEEKRIICEFDDCSMDFAQRNHMLSHMGMVHHSNLSDRIPCTFAGCDKILKDKKTFKTHIKKHDPSAKGVYRLTKDCSNKIGLGKKEDVARRRKTYTDDIFGCDMCDTWFTTQSALAAHRDEKHSV
jgi:hypothetical protein